MIEVSEMKKIIAALLCVILTLGCVAPISGAISIDSGKEALCNKFLDDECEGVGDYAYFEPFMAKFSEEKFPLVIWLHGRSSGDEPRKQVSAYNIVNWASDEYQARFEGSEGAYILLPRSNAIDHSWYDYLCSDLKKVIDDFIAKHEGKIDMSRIYIMGLSAGGSMVYSMLNSYPDFFAAAVPMCAIAQPTTAAMNNWKSVSLWIHCSDNDFYPSANTLSSEFTFNYISSNASDPDKVRMTNYSNAVWADGTRSDDIKMNHYIWDAACFDMHMADGSPYLYATTKNAADEIITFDETEGGLIEWLSQQGGGEESQTTQVFGFVERILSILRTIVDLFNRLLGIKAE